MHHRDEGFTDPALAHAHRTADELFARHGAVFGADLATYHGHVHRVLEVVGWQIFIPHDSARPLGVAAFFHDAGIWFDDTWDYLPPSTRRAREEIQGGDPAHEGLVAALIDEHHRLRPARPRVALVEAFRRADLHDVSAGLLPAPGATRPLHRQLSAAFPARGFRPMLARAFVRGLREDARHPLPMVKF